MWEKMLTETLGEQDYNGFGNLTDKNLPDNGLITFKFG